MTAGTRIGGSAGPALPQMGKARIQNGRTMQTPAASPTQAPILLPERGARGLFFMHVPKTAGSFVTGLFTRHFGAAHCAPFIEEPIADALRRPGRVRTIRADYASAHSPMVLLQRAGIPACFDVFTVLRDPLARLVSHLNWMDRFNHGVDRKAYMALSPDAKRLVQQLGRTDPDSRGDLDRLFRLDELAKARFLFNLQAGMIGARSMINILDMTDLLTLGPDGIAARINRLAACVMLEDFKSGLRAAGYSLPEGQTVNPAKTRRFTASAAMGVAASRYLEADQRFVDMVRSREPDITIVLDHLRAAGRQTETARGMHPAPRTA